MNTLLEHAEHLRDQAMATLLQAEEGARRLRVQAEQLVAYRSDYQARDPARTGQLATIDALRGHLAFMQRLDQAMALQQGQLDAAQHKVATLRQALLAQETRVASVRKLVERRGHEQGRRSAHLEQRRNDEAAMQRHWRERAAAGNSTH